MHLAARSDGEAKSPAFAPGSRRLRAAWDRGLYARYSEGQRANINPLSLQLLRLLARLIHCQVEGGSDTFLSGGNVAKALCAPSCELLTRLAQPD
jgi:hypothetical protein